MSDIHLSQIRSRLQDAILRFQLQMPDGVLFWPPYAANRAFIQSNNIVRGLGKSSPDEIRQSSDYVLNMFPNITSEQLRKKLIDGSLPDRGRNYKGIDCSGFVFYVYSDVYRQLLNQDLIAILGVPKEQVLNGALHYDEWRENHVLTDEEAKSLPDVVSLEWVVDTFKRKAVNLCGVSSLVSKHSSDLVKDIDDIRIGDLVHMIIPGDSVAHIGCIIDLVGSSAVLAHSGRSTPDETGGITIETVPVTSIIDTMKLIKPREFLGVYRLKGL